MTGPTYTIVESKAWIREGFTPRAAHVVEHAGFELKVLGYRVARDGKVLFTAYPALATRAEAEAKIVQLQAAD